MPKVSRNGGPSVAVPPQTLLRVREMHAGGRPLHTIVHTLNVEGIVRDPGDGRPRTGVWTEQAVQDLIDGSDT